ncbi:MAG TPA: hypothetical protein VHG72_05110 [Polyangia bacterium]|nr:hypothetical protein [Polyangia bacterium]
MIIVIGLGCATLSPGTAHAGTRTDVWCGLEPPTSERIIAADREGVWTANGARYRVDGRLDATLVLPAPLKQLRFAATGPMGPVVVGTFKGPVGTAAAGAIGGLLAGYDRQQKETWSVTLGGDDPRNSIRDLHGLYVDDAGNTVLAGHFSGCIRFDVTAKRTCVDPAVAHRNGESCDGEPCPAAFVATYDPKGKLRNVSAFAGYPSQFFAAASDGRVALGGSFIGSLDLDPDPKHEVLVSNPSPTKKTASQAFWSVFEPRASGLRMVDGRALIGADATNVEGLTFDSDGALVIVARVQPALKGATALSDGKRTSPLSAQPLKGLVLLTVPAHGPPSPVESLEPARFQPGADFVLLPSRQGGVFGFGPLIVPPGTPQVEAPWPGQAELAIVGLGAGARGWAVRVPAGFTPATATVNGDQVCFGFRLLGQHQLPGAGGTVTLGEKHAATPAIGCFKLPPAAKEGSH